jgi:4-hydroxy-tetrahydrodipicolinate reductase
VKSRKLAIVGYGKMGKLIEKLAPECGFEVCSRIDSEGDTKELTKENLREAEVAIEFTIPDAAPKNLKKLAELGIPTVSGTTGWYKELPAIRAAFEGTNTPFIYGSNFSIGVNIFDRVIKEAAGLFAKYPAYSAWAWEAHHLQKKDAPSGTLLKLVDTMKHAGFTDDISVSANRAGFIPGTHEIGFDSLEDTITLRHTARSREGFARGALTAADLVLKKKGVFEFSEVLFDEQ